MKLSKLTIKVFSIALGLILVFGCSEHIPDKHEQLYLDTADSLKLYENLPYLKKELIKKVEFLENLVIEKDNNEH